MTIDKAKSRQILVDAHLAVFAAETAEIDAVATARQAGVTWDEIGEDTGMAGPNAHRKFRPYLEETADRTVNVRPIVPGKPCPDCGVKVEGLRAESYDDLSHGRTRSTTVWTAEPCGHTRSRDI